MHRAICVATLAVVTATISACGSSATDPGTEPTAAIQVYSDKAADHEDLLRQQIAEFQNLHRTITVSVVHFAPEQLHAEFQRAALARGGPELVYGPTENIVPWVRLRIIQPVDTLIGSAFMHTFSSNALGAVNYSGHEYAAPDVVGGQLMLLYNRKIATDSAMSQVTSFIWPPNNTNDLLKAAKAFTDPSQNQYGLVFDATDPRWLEPWIGGFGGAEIDGQARPTLRTQPVIDALAYEFSLMNQSGFAPSMNSTQADRIFKAGRAAFIINGDWSIKSYEETFGASLGITRLPLVNKTGKWATPYATAQGYSINANAKGQKLAAAKLFLQYITAASQDIKVAALGDVPANKVAASEPQVVNDPILGVLSGALSHSLPMPIAPQAAAIQDAIKASLADVMSGNEDPATAAATMQQDAERRIAQLGS